MNDDRPKDEEHFPHTCTADSHFLLAFFEEPLVELLKSGNSGNAWNGVEVEDLTKSAGRTSAHERGMDA
jgi:hypothetical protein